MEALDAGFCPAWVGVWSPLEKWEVVGWRSVGIGGVGGMSVVGGRPASIRGGSGVSVVGFWPACVGV